MNYQDGALFAWSIDVIPAKAGVQLNKRFLFYWIPVYTGMTHEQVERFVHAGTTQHLFFCKSWDVIPAHD
jgi:hypothetical protein